MHLNSTSLSALCFLLGLSLEIEPVCAAAPAVTNLQPVNVTASTFTVLWRGLPQSVLEVFADAAARTNLEGRLRIESAPLNAGDPSILDPYQQRQNRAQLRLRTAAYQLRFVRVSRCKPGATYFYRVRSIGGGTEQVLWPATGPLPAVTTAQETAFVSNAQQLLLTVAGGDLAGYVLTLELPGAPFRLAAVVGDGARSDQAYFNLADFLTPDGMTNKLPTGAQTFTAEVLGPDLESGTRQLAVDIPAGFIVAQSRDAMVTGVVSDAVNLRLGATNLLAGNSGVIPVKLNIRGAGVTNVNWILEANEEHLTNFNVQPIAAEVGSVTVDRIARNRFRVVVRAQINQALLGAQPVAQLGFDARDTGHSSIQPLDVSELAGQNRAGTSVTNLSASGSRVVIIGAEPVLQARLKPPSESALVLYGRPGVGYAIEAATANFDFARTVRRIPLTGTFAMLENPAAFAEQVFYRAYEIPLTPPTLDLFPQPDRSRLLTLYGAPGGRYEIEQSSSFGNASLWTVGSTITLSNRFQTVPGLTNQAPVLFYRAVEK